MRPTFVEELPKTLPVLEQWPGLVNFAEATVQFLESRIEENHLYTGVLKHRAIGGLNEGASTQRNDRGIAIREREKQLLQCLGLHLAECRLAGSAKNLGDAHASASFYLAIEIDETPSQSLGKQCPDGGLACPHKPDEEYRAGTMELSLWR